MSFWNEGEHVARKNYRCDECEKAIPAGTRYTRGTGINVHGEFGSWVTHTDCLEATREQMKLAGIHDDWWPLHEAVWEMDAPALAAFALDYPAVFERFREDLEGHDRAPVDHFVWRGFHPAYVPPRKDHFRWSKP